MDEILAPYKEDLEALEKGRDEIAKEIDIFKSAARTSASKSREYIGHLTLQLLNLDNKIEKMKDLIKQFEETYSKNDNKNE